MTYRVNHDTDRTWAEICDTHIGHVNGVGEPIARVVDGDQAEFICAMLNGESRLPAETHGDEVSYLALCSGIIFGRMHKLRDEGIDPERLAELYRRIVRHLPDDVLQAEYARRALAEAHATIPPTY